jgi:hypothetical protein
MGESSLIFAEEFPNGKIFCIDSWEGGFDNSDSCSNADYSDVEQQFVFSVILKTFDLCQSGFLSQAEPSTRNTTS